MSDAAPNRRRGAALVIVLAASLLVGSLVLVALRSAVVHVRLASDARWHVEGAVVASSALAEFRLTHLGELDTLSDGADWAAPATARPDGWSWRATASRRGALIRIVVAVSRLAADGTLFAARSSSLMLSRNTADTVRVLARRARF